MSKCSKVRLLFVKSYMNAKRQFEFSFIVLLICLFVLAFLLLFFRERAQEFGTFLGNTSQIFRCKTGRT